MRPATAPARPGDWMVYPIVHVDGRGREVRYRIGTVDKVDVDGVVRAWRDYCGLVRPGRPADFIRYEKTPHVGPRTAAAIVARSPEFEDAAEAPRWIEKETQC